MIKNVSVKKEEDKVVYDYGWGKMKVTPGGWNYLERDGINSIGFVLVSKDPNDEKPYGVLKEYIPAIDQFVTTAFSGSIDKPEYEDDLELLARTEAKEESGFTVGNEDLQYLGKVYVAKETNHFKHLFAIYVDKHLVGEQVPDSPHELLAEVIWIDGREAANLEDWTVLTILTKSFAAAR